MITIIITMIIIIIIIIIIIRRRIRSSLHVYTVWYRSKRTQAIFKLKTQQTFRTLIKEKHCNNNRK